jgi:hypothetical protein
MRDNEAALPFKHKQNTRVLEILKVTFSIVGGKMIIPSIIKRWIRTKDMHMDRLCKI